MLRFARTVLSFAIYANWIVGVTCTLFLLSVLIGTPHKIVLVAQGVHHDAATLQTYLWLTALTLPPMILAAHVILTRVLRIVRSADDDAVFTLANARNLQTIGWGLLAANLVDLTFGLGTMRLVGAGLAAGNGWSPTFMGWFAALLVFVLAAIWRQGAAMRDELEGIV